MFFIVAAFNFTFNNGSGGNGGKSLLILAGYVNLRYNFYLSWHGPVRIYYYFYYYYYYYFYYCYYYYYYY